MPPIHELTNGRYRVKITPAGGGQSCWDWIALNRWPGDGVEDAHGFFIYLRDVDDDVLWSAALQPTVTQPEQYAASGAADRFTIERRDHGIACTMDVTVHASDDVEVRRLRLKNESDRTRRIEVTSCIEVALAHPMGDLGHPAFSKLFVQTEWVPSCHGLVAKRRPRSHGESWPAMFHAMLGSIPSACETDRVLFMGRGRYASRPAGVMSGTVGNVLDPVFSLRTTLELAPGATADIGFILGAVADHSQVESVIARHQRGVVALENLTPAPSVLPRTKSPASPGSLGHFNGYGGFNEAGSEYVVRMPWDGAALRVPPMPWCNVIANERFGFITSETGAGCTWSRNSQANRLTPWSNDPVSDPHGEALYLRDEDNGEFWSPLPGPCPAAADYEMAHGFGYSRCRVTAHELEHETMMFVPRADPVKLVRVRLKNTGSRIRRLSLFTYHRLVLGTSPPQSFCTWTDGNETLFAKNTKDSEFSDGTAFCFGEFRGGEVVMSNCTSDRRSFIGNNGSARAPQALRQRHLDNETNEPGTDACFAWEWGIELQVGEEIVMCVVLGEAVGDTELQALRDRYRDMAAVDAALAEVMQFWRELLDGVRVKTPSAEINLMVNCWLAYQTIACRMWGRTAFYQSSGAFGFRDQLQDAGNLTLLWPELTRRQILLHARHQFAEGDVLHWWHEAPVGRGVRTRFSDDLLWLPYVTSNYVRATGDASLLDEIAPFLTAPLLKPGEDENYLKPEASGETGSLFEHCCLAIDRSLTCGAHGLPLMGTGDWNDGMNRVGREGRGESVWLGFFLHQILGDFIPMVQARGEDARVARYAAYRQSLRVALNDAGWDGGWYRRAYYDNGKPLGTKDADECRIDGLAQSWAVLSGAAPPDRAWQAMNAAENQLISETDGLIRLLTPPFADTPEDPGYIKGYVAGVRENGGQYTHAACWMVQAMAKLGRRDRAARLLTMLSPLSHTRTRGDVERYKAEPYVIAADVYGAAPHVGRGGWTWYTGSAGWAYRVAIESVLGLRIENGDTFVIKPCVPDDWPEFFIDYRHPSTNTAYHIEVRNPGACSERVVNLAVDGNALPVTGGEARMPIARDGAMHSVVIILGGNE